MTNIEAATFRETPFIPRDIEIDRRSDGTIFMKSRVPLRLRESSLVAYLRRHASERPDNVWIAQRSFDSAGWRQITFLEAREAIDNLTQALLDLRLSVETPLAILSGNSIEHALITYAAFQAGVPVVPLTPAYALQENAAEKLRERLSAIKPGAYFVQNGIKYARALEAGKPGAPVIVVDDPRPGQGDLVYATLRVTPPREQVEHAFLNADPDAPARYMFTSGSSGVPKAVVQSQRNIIVAVESNLTAFGQTGNNGVRRLDWMPWSHVTGAAVLAATLISGGTFYIDDGRPAGADFTRTLANLRDVSPTNYFSMPIGYVMLADALERDHGLARSFFANLLTIGYGGARMPDSVALRLQRLAVEHTGHKVPIVCGYGSTETGPGGALVYWPTDRVGMIGLPHPGYELKLVPIDETRYEVCVRGEGVSKAYLGQPEKTAEMLDADGYYAMGDAASFLAPDNPQEGLVFAGRLSEEFKLVTGTFVRADELLQVLIEATAPLLEHIVVCGEGEQYIAILAWLNQKAAREFLGREEASVDELNADPNLRRQIAERIARHNLSNTGSSRQVARFVLLGEPPSAAAGELADKGSLRAASVRARRQEQVRQLFRDSSSPEICIVGEIGGI